MAVEKIERPRSEDNDDPKVRDCLSNCYDAYTSCWANAGSDLEKAVCNDALNRCTAACL